MQTYLEQWLRLMLRWDPKARGGGLAKDKRPACFTMLDNILAMKVMQVNVKYQLFKVSLL